MVMVPPAALSFFTVFPSPLHVFMFPAQCAHSHCSSDGSSPWCEVPTATVPQRIPPLVWVTFQEQQPSQHGASGPSQLPFLLKGISADGHRLPTPQAAHATSCPHHGLPVPVRSTTGPVMATCQAGQPTAPTQHMAMQRPTALHHTASKLETKY